MQSTRTPSASYTETDPSIHGKLAGVSSGAAPPGDTLQNASGRASQWAALSRVWTAKPSKSAFFAMPSQRQIVMLATGVAVGGFIVVRLVSTRFYGGLGVR